MAGRQRGFEILPAVVRLMLVERGMSRAALARSVNVSKRHVSDLLAEPPRRRPSGDLVLGIAEALRIDPPTRLLAPGEPGDLLMLLAENAPCPQQS